MMTLWAIYVFADANGQQPDPDLLAEAIGEGWLNYLMRAKPLWWAVWHPPSIRPICAKMRCKSAGQCAVRPDHE